MKQSTTITTIMENNNILETEGSIMNLQDNIARMEQELADMKKQLEQQDKLELKGGRGYFMQGHSGIAHTPLAHHTTVKRGAFRATKELAEQADKNMVTRNRLEAHVHEIQGHGEGSWLIANSKDREYKIFDKRSKVKYLGAVYMQKETAEILCEALNKGEIEL